MEQAKESKPAKVRVARHRSKATAQGSRRVEVTVPNRDASLIKAIAGALRQGGKEAKRIRDSVEPLVSSPKAKTGTELVAFFRRSPLIGSDLSVDRDRSAGRTAELG